MKGKILVVEDEGTTRTLLMGALEKAGYEVVQAKDGEEAYQIARIVKPDLIISDVIMPEMDGSRLIKQIRESEFGKKILLIIMTSRNQMQDYFEMMDVDDFITKPFDPQDVIARVERVFAKAKEKK